MFIVVFAALLAWASGQQCEDRNNIPGQGVNPDCNNAGTCIDRGCYCCELDAKTLMPSTFEGIPDCPNYQGGQYSTGPKGPCTTQREFASVTWKYYFPASQNYDCENTANNEQLLQAITDYYAEMNYTGVIVITDCVRCNPINPCRFYDLENSQLYQDKTDGIAFEVGTDLHTFYNVDCFDPADPVPALYNQQRCDPWNYDQGYLAYWTFKRARDYNPDQPSEWNSDGTSDFVTINEELGYGMTESDFSVIINTKEESIRTLVPTSAPSFTPTTEDPTAHPTETPSATPSAVPTAVPTAIPTSIPTSVPTSAPTAVPTSIPTSVPTEVPTTGDTCFEKGYTNQLEDLKYMGNGDNCRAGIMTQWPGGRTCDSPYIVCLPEENTPNQAPKDPFYSDTHQYTVEQCTFECAWDQRCRGFEFVATTGNVGTCTLIDDLPLVIDNQGNYVYDENDTNLMDGDLATKPALCFQKESYCNPFFEAEDLEQTMIDCYCPNNRKGFYTKKVKRTVANTKYCQNDAEVTERIKQAQANRMFHLCENWCLFNTFQPEQESWYWNPWQKCWREQYAGTGTHRSYCNRVIRNPDTIEQYFINYRTNNFCAPMTQVPTGQPSDLGTQWYIAQEEESCTDACESRSAVCSEVETASLGETTSDTDVENAFLSAGITCSSVAVAPIHWAAPVYNAMDGSCLKRNAGTEANTGCQWATGVGYQRLCACTV